MLESARQPEKGGVDGYFFYPKSSREDKGHGKITIRTDVSVSLHVVAALQFGPG